MRIDIAVKEQISNIRNRMFNIRGLSFMLILFYIVDMYLASLRDVVDMLGGEVHFAMFPFLINDAYFNKLLLLLILLFYSDVPFMDNNQMYVVMRIGKQRWGRRNMAYILISSFLLTLSLTVISLMDLFPVAYFENEWNDVCRTLALTDAGNMMDFSIVYSVIKDFSPFRFFLYGFISCWVVTAFFGMLMYTVSLLSGRVLAYAVSAAIMFLPQLAFLTMFHSEVVYFSPAEWMRCRWWRGTANPAGLDLIYIVVAGSLLFFVFAAIADWKINKIDWNIKSGQ